MLDDEPGNPPGTDHGLGFGASSRDVGELDVDLSPWTPLLGMLESTEPEESPGDRPFAPSEGVEGAHALELRAQSMRQYAERGAQRTGALDRTEVGDSDDNRDVVAGRDAVEVHGMLDEHTGHGLVVVADEVETNVGGPLTMHAHLEDNIIMAGVMRDEFAGGTLVTAAMSDDLVAGAGLRCTAALDVWVHGVVGMEERPGTCAADGLLFELAGTLYEREYGPSMHVAAVARHSGTVVTTMKTGFRPLMKTALGVRNLIPGGGGGGGSASASPPAAPPVPPGGEAAGTLQGMGESGGALVRGGADSGDTDDIVSVVRTVENASDAGDVEDMERAASTADNLDDLARVDAEGGGYRQVAEAYEQPLPASAAFEPDAGPGSDSAAPASGYKKAPELDLTEPGADGYAFENSYGRLREQVEHYRADSNWRGNLFSREYLKAVDDKATELFKGLGGDAAALAGDNRNYKTSNIYAAMEELARAAEEAEDLEQLTRIRNAMEELEGFVHGSAVDFAARTDEFAGTALGSQRLPIDSNIDTDKLRRWLQDQVLAAEENFATAVSANDQAGWTRASWERDFYDQVLKSLDAGMSPLAESSEQTVFIQAAKVIPENEKYIEQTTAGLIDLGLDPGEFDIIPPRAADQDQLDAYLEFHDRFVEILSDPEFHRSVADVGDHYTPALHTPGGPGPDQPGPGSPGSLADGLDAPDVHPVVGADEPPLPPPDDLIADPPSGADSAAPGGATARHEPAPLHSTPPLPAADFADSAVYVDDVRDRSFSRSALAASEETLERQAAGLGQGDGSVAGSASVPDSSPPEPSPGSRRGPPDGAQAPVIDERSGRWAVEPPAEPGATTASAQGVSTPAHGDAVPPRASDISWESGLQVSGDSEVGSAAGSADDADAPDLFRAASEPENADPEAVGEMRPSPAPNDEGASGSPTTLSHGSGGEDGNPTDAPPAGATAADAGPGAAGTRSSLYTEPVSLEGRSLEGASRPDDPKELARSVDGAEIPVDDLPRAEPDAAEPGRRSILKNSDDGPVSDTYKDVPESEIERRLAQAQGNTGMRNDSTIDDDSVWRGALWSGDRMDVAARREANSRWSEFAAAERASTVSFSDDPRQLLYHVEYERTVKRRGSTVDLFRGVDPPNTIDRAHAAHYIPRPAGWESTREIGFGRLAQGWNEFPFSPRERIVNSLQRGEALSPDQISALESGLESYRASGGVIFSSQYRAMLDMISDLGDPYRHARWHPRGPFDGRLRQLIEMLDHAAGAV